MFTEIVYHERDHKFEMIRFVPVAVKQYRSEGCTPIDHAECPLVKKEDDAVACVSGSGDSLCGGYYGHMGNNVVRCVETRKHDDS
jgi:hypothetical protein